MQKILYLMMLTLLMGSCKKFLKEASQSDLTPKTTKDFSELLYGDGYPLSGKLLQPQVRFMDDDIECFNIKEGTTEYKINRENRGAYTWQPDFISFCKIDGSTDVLSFNSWKNYYELILGCNVALQYVDGSIGTEKEKRILKGQAFALRAYYHFMLVNLYGTPFNDKNNSPVSSPGVSLKLDANLTDERPARNSVQEVYDQLLKDVDSAIVCLDADKVTTTRYRINHIAAHHLAARIYLMMENWEKVIEHSSVVIQEHPQLIDLNTWPVGDNVLMVGANTEVLWAFGNITENLASGLNMTYSVSTELFNSFESNDLRKPNYVEEMPEFLLPYVSAPYVAQKVGERPGATERGTMWRSAEAYLNRAEAYLQLYKKNGNPADAQKGIDDLMALRNKRYSSPTIWTIEPADQLLLKCRDERRKELCHEEAFRWFDLRRYGMPSIQHRFKPDKNTVVVYTLEERDPQYTLPIPEETLALNPKLVQNKQLAAERKGI